MSGSRPTSGIASRRRRKCTERCWWREFWGLCCRNGGVFQDAPWHASAACPKRELKQSLVPPFLTDHPALAIEWRHLWRIQGAHPAHQGAWLFDGGALHARSDCRVSAHGQRLDENGVRIWARKTPDSRDLCMPRKFTTEKINSKLCRFHLTSRCSGQPSRKRALRPTGLSTPFVRPPVP